MPEFPSAAVSLVKTAIFVIVAPGLVTVYIPRFLLRWSGNEQPVSLPFGIMGGLLIALGAALVLPSMWNFAVVGRGTPAPIDPPRVLVTRAWYRRVRNPMYIGIATIIIGEGVMFRSWTLLGYAVLFLVFCHLFVVLYEEPALRRKFGASYETYRAAVPRWIPGRRS